MQVGNSHKMSLANAFTPSFAASDEALMELRKQEIHCIHEVNLFLSMGRHPKEIIIRVFPNASSWTAITYWLDSTYELNLLANLDLKCLSVMTLYF